MVSLLQRVLPSCSQDLFAFGMTHGLLRVPHAQDHFLSSHFAIRSHPDSLLVSALYKVVLNLLTPLTALLSLLLSFLPVSGLFWRVCEVMEVLQDLNCPILSSELPHRFSASRGAQEVSVTAFQIKLFFLWQISQGSQTTCLPSEQDLIWISALKLCDFIQIYDAKPFREETEMERIPSESLGRRDSHVLAHTDTEVQNWYCNIQKPSKLRTGPANFPFSLAEVLLAVAFSPLQPELEWIFAALLRVTFVISCCVLNEAACRTNSPWWVVSAPTADWDDKGVLWLQQFLLCMPIP